MKLNLKSKFYKILLSFVLLLTTAQAVFATSEDNKLGNENISVITEKIYDEETNTVDIKLTLEAKNTNVSLEGVTFPDESKKIPTEYVKESEVKSEDNTYIFNVGENGEYEFQANYALEVVGEDEQPLSREETYGFKVKVSEINDATESDKVVLEDENTNTIQAAPNKGEISNVEESVFASGEGVSISIPDYDEAVGWNANDVASKTVSITVNFKNTTDRPNRLEIEIPEGLRISSMSVIDGTDVSGINSQTGIVSTYGTQSNHAKAITSMVVPQQETYSMKSVYGKLVYEFNEFAETLTIDLGIKVDETRYYGPHTIPGSIKATTYKVDSLTQEIGSTSQSVNAIGVGPTMGLQYDFAPTTILKKPDSGSTVEGTMGSIRIQLQRGTINVYAKKVTANLTYPVEFNAIEKSSINGFQLQSNDKENGILSYTGTWRTTSNISGSYQVDDTVPLGTYTPLSLSSFEHEFYDGTVKKQVFDKSGVPVEIVDETKNYLTVTGSNATDIGGVPNHYVKGAGFSAKNDSGTELTNQVFEMNIDDSFKATIVSFPIETLPSEGVTVYYTSTTNQSEKEVLVPLTQVGSFTQKIKYINQEMLNLAADDYITSVRIHIGDFSTGYFSNIAANEQDRINAIGFIPKGMGKADITVSIYEKDNPNTMVSTATNSVNELQAPVYSQSSGKFSSGGISAGEKYSVNATLALRDAYGVSTTALVEPEVYIREVPGHSVDINSIKLTGSNGDLVNWTYSKKVNANNETVYIIKTLDYTLFGSHNREQLTVTYDVLTNIRSENEFTMNEIISFGKENMVIGTGYPWIPNRYTVDSHDLNGNGNTTELILGVSANTLKVTKYDGMILETYLSLEGEEPKDPYVPGDDNTVAYFTPGTDADYTVTMLNNGDVSADSFTIYIPIPKTGDNFGGSFQTDSFKWDMTLSKEMPATVGFTIEYSTDANGDNYNSSATYTDTVPTNLSDVKMIRITSNVPIDVAESAEFKVPLKVDETFETATKDKKIGEMNIYSPVYRVVSSKFTGEMPGTLVGTELVMAEIKGTIFEDIDADGLYFEENGDTVIADHEVELYEWDNATSKYEQVKVNGIPVSTKSKSDGTYEFNDTHGLGYGDYAIRFVEKDGGVYQYTINTSDPRLFEIDSDAIVKNDLPNAGDTYRGWVIGITATNPSAQFIGAGFLEYNPPVDLKVAIDGPSEVKSLESIELNATMEPDFWEKIKDSNKPYTWEIIGGATEQAKATLTLDPTTGGARLTAASLASGKTTVKVKLTILDIYGYEAESNELEITILSTEKPVITVVTNPTYIEYGEPTLDEVAFIDRAGISAKDNEGNEISFTTDFDSVVDQTVLKDYTVTITATDSFGNTATRQMTVTVQDKTPPVITLAKDTHTVEMGPEVTFESIVAAFDAKATDNYDTTVTVTNNIADIVKLDVAGSYTVTFTSTDSNGNTSTKTATVVIKDGTPPNITFTKQNILVEINSGQTHDDILVLIGASVTDNSGETLTLSNNITTVKLDTIGTYPVIFTAEDSNGNKASKTATVKVQDTTPPVISVDILEKTIEINGAYTHASLLAEINATVKDNSKESITIVDTITDVKLDTVGTYYVTFNAKDSSGNEAIEVVVKIIVEDTTGPEIKIASPEVSIEINGGTTEEDFIKLAGIEATDNSGEKPTIKIDFDKVVDQTTPGDYKVTVTAEDSDGNITTETVIVTVEDTTPPVITVVDPEVFIEINGGTTEEDIIKLAGIDATDNSGETPTITTDFDTVVDQTTPGDYTVTITVTDSAGNVTTDTIVVTVEDTTAPELTLTNDVVEINLNNPLSDEDFIKLVGPVTSDNSKGKVTVTTDFDLVDQKNPLGEYTVTITATDEAGNVTTETVTVKILDDENPTVSGGEEYSYIVGGDITLEQLIDDIGFIATDNSDQTLYPVSITSDIANVDFSKIGTYDVTITVTDVSGNVTKHVVTINVVREATYHIEAERVIIDVKDVGAILALDNVEDKVIELLNAKAWLDDAINGITDLPVYIKNYEEMINFLSRKDLANGDLFDVILTTNNPLSRSLFGSETVAQIEITGVVEDLPVVDETPKLPATGVGNSYIALYGGVLAVFGGLILSYSKKKKEEENC